jgi:hypothetical protein
MPLMETTRNILIATLAVIVACLAVLLFTHTNREHSRFTCTGGTYTGDTIYRIAIAECQGNLDNAIYQTVKINGGSLIHPGQALILPTG